MALCIADAIAEGDESDPNVGVMMKALNANHIIRGNLLLRAKPETLVRCGPSLTTTQCDALTHARRPTYCRGTGQSFPSCSSNSCKTTARGDRSACARADGVPDRGVRANG